MGEPKFGVFLPFYAFQTTDSGRLFTRVRDTVLECERLGYDSVWLDDHLMFGQTPMLECWTTLSALAQATTKIRLGTMVTSQAFRNPALLAKMAATVDRISDGRLELGLGAGVQKQEHKAYGYLFPDPKIRVRQLQETLEILKLMWTQEKATYTGRHYRVFEAVCEPKPVQKPHPPLTVGGSGEKSTLKVTAQYADRLDFGYLPLEEYKLKLGVLEWHCQAAGREFSAIEKSCWPTGQIILAKTEKEAEEKMLRLKPANVSVEQFRSYSFVGTPQEFKATLQPFLDLGVTQFMLYFGDLPDVDGLKKLATV
jgi:F420-dependent oxidoreductase-like protein